MSHTSSGVEAVKAAPEPAGSPPELIDSTHRVIVPAKRRVRLREVWTSFAVGRMLGGRDIKVKYKQSALGPLWLVLQPLGMLIAVSIAFSAVTNVSTGNVPYVVFAIVGLTAWTYFQMTLTQATAVLPMNSAVVRRSPCPRVALVTGTLIATLPPLAVMLPISFVAALTTGGLPTQVLLLPLMVAWLFLMMWGITLFVSSLSGRFRDMVAFAPLIVQAGIFLTPVGYPLSSSNQVSTLIALNPISGIIEGWRWAMLGVAPDTFALFAAGCWTVGLVLIGWYVFGRMETRFADYV
jgi:lipopolysaccharide transport system permease protein